ncbi:MAG: lycopene cyclase domain-containing protein [Anaerolineae bacterium]
MTYFGFLGLFVCIPILVLGVVALRDWRRGVRPNSGLNNLTMGAAILLHSAIALVYTTPWDNYLVATRVWWYDPTLVNGLVIGYVPIEEYTFFVLQPILTGLWIALLMRRLPVTPDEYLQPGLRKYAVGLVGIVWTLAMVILVSGWRPGTYLGLELGWALLPVMLQLGFGADILWRYRRHVLAGILIPTLYLSAADTLAIRAGTWTIDPAQSLQVYLPGGLPLEELVFFLLTNTLITFGLVLIQAQESLARVPRFFTRRQRIIAGQ